MWWHCVISHHCVCVFAISKHFSCCFFYSCVLGNVAWQWEGCVKEKQVQPTFCALQLFQTYLKSDTFYFERLTHLCMKQVKKWLKMPNLHRYYCSLGQNRWNQVQIVWKLLVFCVTQQLFCHSSALFLATLLFSTNLHCTGWNRTFSACAKYQRLSPHPSHAAQQKTLITDSACEGMEMEMERKTEREIWREMWSVASFSSLF